MKIILLSAATGAKVHSQPVNNRFWSVRYFFIALLLLFVSGTFFYRQKLTFCLDNPVHCARIASFRIRDNEYTKAWFFTAPELSGFRPSSMARPFYGMQYVPESDLDQVAELGINAVLQDFPHDGRPEDWLEMLDLAHSKQMQVVAWQWPPGWQWDESTNQWDIDDEATLFINSVADHPALLAIYGTHEAYWQDCFGCGYTTAQLQLLYSQIKEIANVPIYSAFDGFEFWRQYSDETTFADGICDYCDTWYYPATSTGYDRDEYIRRLQIELATFRELAPNSKFVWVLQGFEYDFAGKVMPTAQQMADMAAIALETDVDGLWWYVWTFSDQYQDFLVNRPELHNTVRGVYDEYLAPPPVEFSNHTYLPLIPK